jgi:cell division protein ZapD
VTESAYTCFEQPLNERTRTFLRLEHLFTQLQHHERDDSNWGRRAALTALLDILTVLSRHDLRNEVGKELAEQHATLSRLKNRPDVDHERLEGILSELVMLGRGLQAIPPKFASYMLRDNDLLTSISNRSAIPGGACGFDLPGYQSWLSLPSQEQARYLAQWDEPLKPFRESITLILRLIRESAEAQDYTAEGGVLVHNTSNDTQLIRVLVPADERVYPEISAGRHRSTVRFMEQYGGELHSRQTDRDIPFRMACCRL